MLERWNGKGGFEKKNGKTDKKVADSMFPETGVKRLLVVVVVAAAAAAGGGGGGDGGGFIANDHLQKTSCGMCSNDETFQQP